MSRQPKRPRAGSRRGSGVGLDRRSFARSFALRVAAWLPVVVLVWVALTPSYNYVLTGATENLLHWTEFPDITSLEPYQGHHFLIFRRDFPESRGHLYSVKVTSTHFPLVMLGAFFLAVPGVGWRRRLENLGWALLASIFFHIFSLFLWVKFVYATQLGDWSTEHYGTLARNFWGLSKHLADLPFKFAWPFILWSAFYIRHLLPDQSGASSTTSRSR